MTDKAPFVYQEASNYPKASGNARQVFPGSNPNQVRPSIIKRDSDIAAPDIKPMGADYSYGPARNKK